MSTIPIQHSSGSLYQSNQENKEKEKDFVFRKIEDNRKQKLKLSPFTLHNVLCKTKPLTFIQYFLLELINKFFKVVGYKAT